MYAVIRTGGKQYKVQAGDLLVVEKLAGEPGAEVSFGEVLMLGDGGTVTIGAPAVDGASVTGTLIETRKGEKIKVFKKIRRQGYRRTGGHRQLESVIRVTAVAGGGKTDNWDGTVDLTPKALLDARARNLKNVVTALEGTAPQAVPVAAEPAPKAKAAKAKAAAVEEAAPAVDQAAVEADPAADTSAPEAASNEAAPAEAAAKPAKKPAPKKAAAPKADQQ